MKKIPSLLLAVLLLLTACASTPDAAEEPIRIMALKGPTAMGMAPLIDAGDPNYTFTLAGSIDEVTPQLAKGETDIAALPANLAAVLYQSMEGDLEVLAINTLGVLYLVERGDTVTSAEDLRGRTVFASGKGATPEYALRYVLTQSGLDPDRDLDIQWKSEHQECLAALLAEENALALLPQPFVTAAQMKNAEVRTALDLNVLWEESQDTPSALITGVTVVRRSFADDHPEAVAAFLDAYAESVDSVNTDPTDAARIIGELDIVPEQVALKALPACHIVCIRGEEMQSLLSGYLAVLLEQNPKSVGGALPGEDFYYVP